MIFPEMHNIRHVTPTCIPIPHPFELKYLLDKGVKFPNIENVDKISKLLEKSRVANYLKMADVILPAGWGIYRNYGFFDKDGTPDIYGPKSAFICDEHGEVIVEILWDWKYSCENFTQIQRLCYHDGTLIPTKKQKYCGKIVDGWIVCD